jgi:GWxTD domain-containing protein
MPLSKGFFIAIIFVTALASCYTPGRVNRPNPDRRPKNVQPDQPAEKLTARIKLFHSNADTMRIYFILDTRSQDYFLLNDKSKFKAVYTLNYEITRLEKNKKTKTDSLSLQLVDVQSQAKANVITAYVETKLPVPDNYSIKLSVMNSNKNARYEYFMKFSNLNCTDPENYILMTMDETPVLDKNFTESSGQVLKSAKCDAPIELYKIIGGVDYPTPPFAADDFASKNNYDRQLASIDPTPNGAKFTNLDKGIYFLKTNENSGIVFYHFTKWYPNCTDTSGFYDPLIYLCSRAEYEELGSGENTRQKFEKWWLDRAHDETRTETYTKQNARRAIKEYYKRVFAANAEYTSTSEGWKTDRGMIAIVFGKPNYIDHGINREVWHYKTTFNATLTFTFDKVDNPYSDNDYHLQRDINFKAQWYNALDNWRRAKPFNLNGN